MKPVAHFCIRRGLKLQDVTEVFKEVAVQAAQAQLTGTQADKNHSRLSTMTGVHRKDVARILQSEKSEPRRLDLIQRVIGQWRYDPRFSNQPGEPKVLTREGPSSSFFQLVRSVSLDINPLSVLAELERTESVSIGRLGVKLERAMYVPTGNVALGFKLLGADIDELTRAVEENLLEKVGPHNLHIRTEFDRIPLSASKKVRQWLLREGSEFHAKVRSFLAGLDRDINPKGKAAIDSCRVVVGAFSHIDSAALKASHARMSQRSKS